MWREVTYNAQGVREFIMIILGLGTNIEPREQYLRKALEEISQRGIKITKQSKIYQTPAWGGVANQNFLNMCIEVDCNLKAHELLDIIQERELDRGRVRLKHWGNRTIDIDIIEYKGQKFNDERLTVPHKYLHDRNFVLQPIYELYGDVKIDGKSIKKSLENIDAPIEVYLEKI